MKFEREENVPHNCLRGDVTEAKRKFLKISDRTNKMICPPFLEQYYYFISEREDFAPLTKVGMPPA